MSKKLLLVVFVFSVFSAYSQTAEILTAVSPAPVSLETILTEAEKQTLIYRNNFNNLLAEEIKTFEDFDKNGEIKKTRRIESNFLVYQSVKLPEANTEYRNVTKVDGKPIGNAEKRAEDFFKDVLNSSSSEKELEKIQKESSRYDTNLEIKGLTLHQAPVLASHIRAGLNFTLAGEETLENRSVYVIDYIQNNKIPYVVFDNSKTTPGKLFLRYSLDLPKQFRKNEPFLSGRLWIDKETFQVLAEQRNVSVRLENKSEPVTVMAMSFNYQFSELGVLTPKKIVLTDYNIRIRKDEFSVAKGNIATFEYTKFSLSDVEVQSGEVDASGFREN
jgi:hypothetical protein